MNNKKKIRLLSAAAVLLLLIYVLSIAYDFKNSWERRAGYTWINREILESSNRIELSGMAGPVVLERKNNIWVMPIYFASQDIQHMENSIDYPVKQSRVGDLFNALSRRSSYPERSFSAESLERLGLGEDKASRIRIRGGAGLPLLDLLIGFGGAAGSGIYFRRAGSTEARSGEDIFSAFTETGRKSWYDLRLFKNLSAENIQRVRVNAPKEYHSFILERSGRGWLIYNFLRETGETGTARDIDRLKAESYIHKITGADAEDFFYHLKSRDAIFTGTDTGSVIVETGDGKSAALIAALGAQTGGNYPAAVSGSGFVYSLGERTLKRIFPANGEL